MSDGGPAHLSNQPYPCDNLDHADAQLKEQKESHKHRTPQGQPDLYDLFVSMGVDGGVSTDHRANVPEKDKAGHKYGEGHNIADEQ